MSELPDPFKTTWSCALPSKPAGLCLARERGWLLAWDSSGWVYLLDQRGEANAQRRLAKLSAACAADDGAAYAAGSDDGQVWWLAPDLMPLWEKKLTDPVLALALDSHSQYLAVADRRALSIFDRQGKEVCRSVTPRALHHLAFVPAAPLLVGSADYGLIAGYQLTGEVAWRDGLVARVGDLSVNGAGTQLLLACYSEGLHQYGENGLPRKRLAASAAACRTVTQSFPGDKILIGDMQKRLLLLDKEGQAMGQHALESNAVALAMEPLGRFVQVALEHGPILQLALTHDS